MENNLLFNNPNFTGNEGELQGCVAAPETRLLHQGSVPRGRQMGLRHDDADRLPTQGTLHGHGRYVARTKRKQV